MGYSYRLNSVRMKEQTPRRPERDLKNGKQMGQKKDATKETITDKFNRLMTFNI